MRRKLRAEIYTYLEDYLDRKFEKWVESLHHMEMWIKLQQTDSAVKRIEPKADDSEVHVGTPDLQGIQE